VKHFINPNKEYLEKLQQISNAPKTKIMPALGQKSQIQKWTDIFDKIPKHNQIYIYKSLNQLKLVQKDY